MVTPSIPMPITTKMRTFPATPSDKMAYGFEKILDELKRKDEGSFRVHMTSYFGSNTSYYRYKLGQTGLVPEQQQYILQWCKGRGYTNMRFDRYTEEVNY